jgi:gamma-glutamyl:cysteine ligase YbdK (ATP-grasp superfamily)
MGADIDRDRFDEAEFAPFAAKLERNLEALAELLRRPGFGVGPPSVGAELELNLVDDEGRPALLNRQLLEAAEDPRLTLEANRFNAEINSPPTLLCGRPWSTLHAELSDALGVARDAGAAIGARIATIGILPTLGPNDLGPGTVSDAPRFRALANGLLRIRREPFRVRIEGEEALSTRAHDTSFEGATTSLQVHLRVNPEAFADTYNAAQLATGVALACACNAPFFLGKRLWHETRVALFRQSVDDRTEAAEDDWRPARVSFGHGWVRREARELFEEAVALHEPVLPVLGSEDPLAVVAAGGTPSLAELRLHQGTVWRWNRAIYDPVGGGHLRVEMRALPAGPTLRDAIANAAFIIGLTLGLTPRMSSYAARFTFGHARHNFYTAARQGLDAELLWPHPSAPSPRLHPARVLIERVLPLARTGLIEAGVEPGEAEKWLAIIAERTERRQTGATWQLRAFERARAGSDESTALRKMLARYLDLSEGDTPVHTWPS